MLLNDKMKPNSKYICKKNFHLFLENYVYETNEYGELISPNGSKFSLPQIVGDEYFEEWCPKKLIRKNEPALNAQSVYISDLKSIHKEMVNHPDHYKGNKFEVIDIIHDYNLGFDLGNAVKYLLRAGKKDNTIQDLKKAIWYIEHEIKTLENK